MENCNKSEIIPRFLIFIVPNNGCFDDQTVREFQLKLLKKEIVSVKRTIKDNVEKVSTDRHILQTHIPDKYLPSIILHTRFYLRQLRKEKTQKLDGKFQRLSQERIR